MPGKDYWNIITPNAKRVTSHGEFRRSYAGDLLLLLLLLTGISTIIVLV